MIDIQKAFEGRWKIKVEKPNSSVGWVKGVRELCRDFFEAGVLIGRNDTYNPEHEIINYTGEYKKATPVNISHDPILNSVDEGFSEWWELYGKKIDRAKCEKKWAKLSYEEKRACIMATPAYVASTPDLQYRRHPMTYLNNKSWENQIIPHNGTNKPSVEQQRIDKLADIITG